MTAVCFSFSLSVEVFILVIPAPIPGFYVACSGACCLAVGLQAHVFHRASPGTDGEGDLT